MQRDEGELDVVLGEQRVEGGEAEQAESGVELRIWEVISSGLVRTSCCLVSANMSSSSHSSLATTLSTSSVNCSKKESSWERIWRQPGLAATTEPLGEKDIRVLDMKKLLEVRIFIIKSFTKIG